MFIYTDLINYENDFYELNITDKDSMLGILNTLDEIAEINYYIFKIEKEYDKES